MVHTERPEAPPAATPALGVPAGTHMRVRLPADLTSIGPVDVGLVRPLVIGEQSVFPSRTRLRGQASVGEGRLNIIFRRAVLPGGTEVPISGVAFCLQDGREGLPIGPSGEAQLDAGSVFDVVLDAPL